MSKFVSFASDIRVRALLCSSVTVLLTACGGGANTGAADALPTQNAALSYNSAAAPAAASAAAPAQAATAGLEQASDTAPVSFDIVGYGDAAAAEAVPADPAAPAPTAPADGAGSGSGAPRLLAMSAVSVKAVTPSTANNFYVAPNGSDSNPGTRAAPFKTITRAAQAARPNTNIFVAPGTYAGGFQTTVSGTQGGRIFFVSTTKHGARIVPPANSTSDSAWDNRGNYVNIIGFDVDGSASQSGKKWLQGIYTGGSYNVIKDNHVHHIAQAAGCTSAGGSAIGLDAYYHGAHTDVINNIVNDIGPAGCTYIQGIYMSTSGSIKNNLVYRVAEAGIHLWHDANNVVITNNTVTGSHTGIIVGSGDHYFSSSPADNVVVNNNIVYDNYYGISEQGSTGRNNSYRNNLVNQNVIGWSLKNGLTHSGTVSSAPLLVGYSKTGTPNFHLTSSSPAIGRGTASNAYPTDMDGKARSASTGYDIGAYQH
jgi:hypothetical protein